MATALVLLENSHDGTLIVKLHFFFVFPFSDRSNDWWHKYWCTQGVSTSIYVCWGGKEACASSSTITDIYKNRIRRTYDFVKSIWFGFACIFLSWTQSFMHPAPSVWLTDLSDKHKKYLLFKG